MRSISFISLREKHPFIDKQSQIAERKTVGGHNKKVPGPHEPGQKPPIPHPARARDRGSSEEA